MPNPSSQDFSRFDRRSFLRFAAIAAAGAAVPIVGESHLAMAQRSKFKATLPTPGSGAVMIDANENPLGPCASARSTIMSLVPSGGRYEMALTDKLVGTIAAKENLKPENIAVYAGSSEPLHYAVLAFTSKDRGYVAADPGYEAGAYAAKMNNEATAPESFSFIFPVLSAYSFSRNRARNVEICKVGSAKNA